VIAIQTNFVRSLCAVLALSFLAVTRASADDGYRLWLKYDAISNRICLAQYRRMIQTVVIPGHSQVRESLRDELRRAVRGLLGRDVRFSASSPTDNAVIVATGDYLRAKGLSSLVGPIEALGSEGYAIKQVRIGKSKAVLVVANEERGLLYGAFAFVRLIQTRQSLDRINIVSMPKIHYRLLNHWDNLDGTVERGYAGTSLWKWSELPGTISSRYRDYARACASIGINGVVLNNVNANPKILTPEYLAKVAALAGVFRPYGVRVFLSVNFSSPISARFEQEGNRKGGIGNLKTSDPLDPGVQAWWNAKAAEIYGMIPDFGGFLVKASSEGMPGPQEYNRTHADGANMLAKALRPFRGIVMWRSFVYDANSDVDRVKRAYKEFVPLDGKFDANVLVQAKNGPLDFQPREPVQPLFGAMTQTPMMLELQITQEYLGHSTHLVYLAPMWKEYLQFDTHAPGAGSPLASIIDGSTRKHSMTGIAGVTNIGDDLNWCGHLFGQANWYAFGRIAWDHTLSSEAIANEWIRMTFGHDSVVVSTVRSMMMGSWEACINYMTPLGLHHIMQPDFHYGPGPQHDTGRVDWRSTYYHRADSTGLGYDRSSTGSDAVSQYSPPLREEFNSPATCPEKYLLWFHHVPWDYRMRSGRSLWDELCFRYRMGTDYVDSMYSMWLPLDHAVDPAIFAHVKGRIEKQRVDAWMWRDTCLEYFRGFSRRDVKNTF
jgi:alpha-glucuronidase